MIGFSLFSAHISLKYEGRGDRHIGTIYTIYERSTQAINNNTLPSKATTMNRNYIFLLRTIQDVKFGISLFHNFQNLQFKLQTFFLNSYSVMLTFFCKYGKLYYKFHSGRFHLPASKTKSPTSLPLKSLRGSADTTLPNASNAEGTFWHPYHQCAVGRGNAGFASSTYWA